MVANNARAILQSKKARQTQVRVTEITLAINGVIVAFFVGLLVNQSTDIIGYWKGSFQASNIWITVGIAVALLVICIIIFAYMFISELIKMLRKDKNETN